MNTIDLETLANRVKGTIFSGQVDQESKLEISGVAPLQDADAGQITLIDNEKHLFRLQASKASACVTPQLFPQVTIPQIVVANPHEAFALICKLFRPIVVHAKSGVDPRSCVTDSAQIAQSAVVEALASVGDHCVIGERTHIHRGATIMAGCQIGADCQIFPGAVLYPGTVLEDRVTIHANCVLGAHGFGYRVENGRHVSSAQLGWVHVESDVEIGAGTTVDRGTYGATRIGEGTKIDNMVQIAHNCKIGKHNLICAQVGIAGSCSTGDHVVLAGQVGMKDHIHIGNRSVVLAKSGVSDDIPDDQMYFGIPAVPRKEQAMIVASMHKLPEIRKTVKQLERQVERLCSNQQSDQQERKAG